MDKRRTMSTPRAWAVICRHHINAHGIASALCEVGWSGPIVCLKNRAHGRVLMELFGDRVDVWETELQTPKDVIDFLAERIPAEDEKVVFFTDECFHRVFLEERNNSRLPNSRFFIGAEEHLDTVLDRHAFYRFIEERQIAAVPRTIPGDADPWSVFPDGFCMRLKESWRGLVRLRGVKLINERRQWEKEVDGYRQWEYTEDDWCYQEILSISTRDNISVCGWHDGSRRTYIATRKVLQHPPRSGNADVCERIEPPDGLMDMTRNLLDSLEYAGPFELEFLLDMKTGEYKIIELNPRFWLQHGLVGAISGQELVRRYVGLPSADGAPDRSPTYWINTVYAVFRMLRGDIRVLRYLRGSGTVCAPSPGLTLRWIPRFLRKIPNKLRPSARNSTT